MTLRSAAELLERAAARHPDKAGLVAQGRRLTWAELSGRAARAARALREKGVGRGDRVVLYGDNSVDLAVGAFAALYADACFVVVSGMTRAEKLAYVLRDSGAAALVADAALAPHWVGACSLLGAAAPPTLVMSGLSPRPPEHAVEVARAADVARCEALDPLAASMPDAPPPRASIDLDLAMIIYTSGSTGEPKGAMLSHRNVDFSSWSVTTLLENTADDVIFSTLPLAFNYGLYQWLMAARLGATLVLERAFTFPLQSLARAAAERATGFPGVPTMFAMLAELQDAERPDLASVRYVTSTAAQLLPRHVAALGRFFPAARVYSMYGLTECKRVSWLPPADLARKPDSVGLPIPGTEFWVVDDEGRRLPPGEAGELVVRGSHVMRGYWGKPALTERFLRPGPLPGEQVLYTGDLCRVDDEGHLHFIARMDEVIKSRGEKVAPREVEKAIERIEGVRECAVVPVADEVLGAAIKAFVVLEESWRGRYTERDIALRAGQFVEPYMVPKHVEFRDALPKTDLGKILKKALLVPS
ncbi:MAG: class I adenylate-forming enzyme family protein [Polyangiales bacterium]